MEKKRYGALDFLKIIGTVLIMFMHYQQLMEVTFPSGANFFNGGFNWGNVVEFFFVVSGFVIYPKNAKIYSGEDGGFVSFYLKCLLRFAPMMALTAICYEMISLVMVKVYGDASGWACICPWGIVQNTLCIRSWGRLGLTVNSPTWYVSVLMFCYLVMYLITRLCGKYGKNPMIGYIAMIILGIGINTSMPELPFLDSDMGRGYSAFFTGTVLAALIEKYEMHSRVQIVYSFIIFALTAVGLIFDTASMTFLLYPAIIIVFTTKTANRIFSAGVWKTLGRIQYHAYVWHAVILLGMRLLVWTGHHPDYSRRLTMFAFAIFTELWAAFSCLVLEKPAEKLFLKILPKRKLESERI